MKVKPTNVFSMLDQNKRYNDDLTSSLLLFGNVVTRLRCSTLDKTSGSGMMVPTMRGMFIYEVVNLHNQETNLTLSQWLRVHTPASSSKCHGDFRPVTIGGPSNFPYRGRLLPAICLRFPRSGQETADAML